MCERSSDSDTDSTVSVGEDADRHIEAPFAAEYNGLLGRLVRLLGLGSGSGLWLGLRSGSHWNAPCSPGS